MPPAAPAPASLSASQAAPVSLVAGGGPAELPITVRNTGGTRSEPVTATLRLPPGVTAVAAGDRYGPAPLLRLNTARADTVKCPGGTGTVTCSTTSGLDPGESVTLLFRVLATKRSAGGLITGTITAGSMINVDVSVRVDVRPPPTVDGVVVSADAEWLGLLSGIWLHPTLEARAKNTGTSTKPVTVTVDQPAHLISANPKMTCTTGEATTCTTVGDVAPHEVVTTVFELDPGQWPVRATKQPLNVHVTATLGAASDSTDVRLHPWLCPPGILLPVPPEPDPATPAPGSPSTEAPPVSGESTGKPSPEPTVPPTSPSVPPSLPAPPSSSPRPAVDTAVVPAAGAVGTVYIAVDTAVGAALRGRRARRSARLAPGRLSSAPFAQAGPRFTVAFGPSSPASDEPDEAGQVAEHRRCCRSLWVTAP